MGETRLREALELLRRDGWCQFSLHDRDGRHCAVGIGTSSQVYAGAWSVLSRDMEALSDVARHLYPERTRDSLVTFNNHRLTTFADIETVFEKAAAMREEAVE